MSDKSSIRLGWEAMTRHPALWFLVILWDLAKWGLAWLGLQLGFGWIRLDYNNIGYQPTPPGDALLVRLMLPPALPSAEQLGVNFGAQPPSEISWDWLLASAGAIALVMVLEPLLRAGYLNLLNASIRGVPLGFRVFWRGVLRFGLAQFLLTALWWPVAQLQAAIAQNTAAWVAQVALVFILLTFYMAQYVIVTDDANVLQALLGAPLLLLGHLEYSLLPIAFSALITGALSAALSSLGVMHPLVVVPVYAIAATGLATAFLAALQEGMSTRAEPSMPWACRHCQAQNDLGKKHCVVCGRLATPIEVKVAPSPSEPAAS